MKSLLFYFINLVVIEFGEKNMKLLVNSVFTNSGKAL